MNRCAQCKQPIVGEHVRLDAGVRLGTDIAFDILDRDINLHSPCHGPWMLAHYPWLVTVSHRERTSLD